MYSMVGDPFVAGESLWTSVLPHQYASCSRSLKNPFPTSSGISTSHAHAMPPPSGALGGPRRHNPDQPFSADYLAWCVHATIRISLHPILRGTLSLVSMPQSGSTGIPVSADHSAWCVNATIRINRHPIQLAPCRVG
jgi:hypothetical protein